jgi:two-component system, chemotaxis family, chemotaxis protein CheY
MPSPVGHAPFPSNFSLLSFLIVDDQPFSRRLVRSMLQGFGSREVYESANGVEAFELARAVMPSMIITDLIMPIFDGMRFLKMVKAPQSPARNVPVIVLSGYLTKAAALTVKDAGADELLVKPVSPKALYDHIARIVWRQKQASVPAIQTQDAELTRKKTGGLAFI